MSYYAKKLSQESLRKILLVLKDIRHQAEIQDKTEDVNMGWVEGLEGVPRSDHKNIMENLIDQHFVQKNEVFEGRLYLNVDLDWLDHHMEHVEDALAQHNTVTTPMTTFSAQPTYDFDRGVLQFKANNISIKRREEPTIAHGILSHIFRGKHGPLNANYFFAEIAEYEFGDMNYAGKEGAWKRYYTACKDINEKIRKDTPDRIEDFLVFNTGKRAYVRINPRYL